MKLTNLPNHKQRGFVLVVCLIILLVLTVLGVNNMGTSNLEQRMASNTQTKLDTLQSAESAIVDTYSTATDVNTAILAANPNNPNPPVSNYNYPGTVTSTTTNYISDNPTNVTSSNLNLFAGPTVEIVATSSNNGTGAQTVLVQGITKIIPKQ
jgi:Tfp pilus assembly protein PilX